MKLRRFCVIRVMVPGGAIWCSRKVIQSPRLAGNLNRRFNMLRGFLLTTYARMLRIKGTNSAGPERAPDRVLVPPRNYHRPTYVCLGWVQVVLEVSYWREIAFGAPNPGGTSEVAVAPGNGS